MPGLRQAGIACQHGYFASSFEDWDYAVKVFALEHPQCPVRWIAKTWHPAGAAVRAALAVTATPHPAARAALAAVRAHGETVAAFLAANGCSGCDVDLREVAPVGQPGAAQLTLLHTGSCEGPTR